MDDSVKQRLRGRVVFAGVGNVLKGDDGFGSLMASALKGKVAFKVFDTGTAPENYLGVVVRERPDTIIFADTADFGDKPGEIHFLSPSDFSDSSFYLTHNTSLKLLFEFMAMDGLKADVLVLCCRPRSMRLGDELSPEVDGAIKTLSDWFIRSFPKR